MFKEITLKNILSFDEEGVTLECRPLNVLIGANGSGKSNLLEVLGLLRSLPRDDSFEPIRRGGGIKEWIWKGNPGGEAEVRAVLANRWRDDEILGYKYKSMLEFSYNLAMRYSGKEEPIEVILEEFGLDIHHDDGESEMISPIVAKRNSHHVIVEEFERRMVGVAKESPIAGATKSVVAGSPSNGLSFLSSSYFRRLGSFSEAEMLAISDFNSCAQELNQLISQVFFFRDWVFGKDSPSRTPQPTDLRGDFLSSSADNIAKVLSLLRNDVPAKRKLVEALTKLYHGVRDYYVSAEGNSLILRFEEKEWTIPATRLSDGTLRYLCLLAILCHPTPPPVVCIEEPELGLHPDILPGLVDLMRDASTRTQLFVTTHSEMIVDCLTESPEDVVVCEKHERGTQMHRLTKEEIKPWLDKYRLGELWSSGEIGGNRW